MGATTFENRGKGRSAQAVFSHLRDDARYEHGNGGYTGSIAEKSDFQEVGLPPEKELHGYIDELIDDGNKFADKWGPAGCICIKPPEPIKPLTQKEAERLAIEKFGSTATIEVKRTGGKSVASLKVVSKNGGWGMNESVPGGWRNTQKTVQAADANTARGALFAEDGEYVFFGWASD
jgi:hypothetical protein